MNRHCRRILILTAVAALWLALVPTASAQSQDRAEVALKAAMDKEMVDGDLKGAIEQYKKIAQSGNRAVAAKALVRMGQCYEKLGNAEARKTYQRVLREYAEQQETVAEARARLSALSVPAGSTNGSMVARRVWAGRGVDTTGATSADGRYISFTDWATGDLAVRDLSTGESRHVTNKGSWSDSGEFALFSVLSPDGKEAVYGWFGYPPKSHDWELRVVGLDGSKPRTLYRTSEADYEIAPADWSPDGKQVLAILYRSGLGNQILLISVANGSSRILKTLPWGFPFQKMRFSPDGRYIAYDFQPRKTSEDTDVYLLSADGSRDIALIEHPAHDFVLGWAPDGKKLLFASNRTGTTDVWLIELSDGRPQGTPQLVRKDIGKIEPLGFTRTGSYYYAIQTGMNDVYTAEIDPATGKLVSSPTPVSRRLVGSHSAPSFSPDGKYLLYISGQRISVGAGRTGGKLGILTLESGEERELSPGLSSIFQPRWFPDGHSILARGSDQHHGLYRIDARSGEATLLFRGDNIFDPVASADGKAVLYRQFTSETGTHLVERTLETGQEKELYRGKFKHPVLSPDGRNLAFAAWEGRSGVLKVMPAAGGPARALLELPDDSGLPIAWDARGRYLLFVKTGKKGKELWRVPVAGGEPSATGMTMENLRDLSVHPDGRRIAVTAGAPKAEVWVMENFLPSLKASR